MNTYIVLCAFERPADDGVALDEQAYALAGALDATEITSFWATTGGYDVVVVLEADSSKNVDAFAAAFGSLGGLTTTTLAAAADNSGEHTKMGVTGDPLLAAPPPVEVG